MYYNKHQKQENQIVKNLGGLYIIGTERNDSRRVDNQLRGRCGRQGDPGTSQFFLSLEDNLLRLFGGSRVQTLLQSTMVDDLPLESNLLTRSLNSAQQKVEERAYQQRKNLFDYDEVLNKQRRGIYSDRIRILNKESLRRTIIGYGEQVITNNLLLMQTEKISSKEISSVFEDFFGKSFVINSENPLIFQQYLFNEFWLLYQAKRNELAIYGDGICDALERTICLVNIDQIWREHLQEMPLLREAVGWRGYGQQNPLYEYKKDALKFFSKRIRNLSQLVIYDFLRSSVS
jgi:preprotein translocase subunit SecA